MLIQNRKSLLPARTLKRSTVFKKIAREQVQQTILTPKVY